MDGKGRWMDNVLTGRLWGSVRREGVYLSAHETVHELEKALARWLEDYNRWKPHQSLDSKTPWQCHRLQKVRPMEKSRIAVPGRARSAVPAYGPSATLRGLQLR